MKIDSPMLSPRNGDPIESNYRSVALPFSYNASGVLTDIAAVGEGSGTVNKPSERFSSATINSGLFDSYQ